MAQTIGQSGAYRVIVEQLARQGLAINSPNELVGLRDALAARNSESMRHAAADFGRLEFDYQRAVAECQTQVAEHIASQRPHYDQRILAATDEVNESGSECEELGKFGEVLFRPFQLVRWVKANVRRKRAVELQARREYELRCFLEKANSPLDRARQMLLDLRAHREEYIASWMSGAEQQLECVENIITSGEAAGAAAEVECVNILQGLGEQWTILNDVCLQSSRWFYYNEKHLGSAQLDHVLVGPGGIFIIETKNWSKEFTATGEYFDPFEQVSRASYLCHRMLREESLPCKTRSIIATRSRLASPPVNSYVKVMHPEEIRGFVTWFNQQISPEDAKRIVGFLSRFVNVPILHGQPRHTSRHPRGRWS